MTATYTPVETTIDQAVRIWVDVAREHSTNNGNLETELKLFAHELKCILMDKQPGSMITSEPQYVRRVQFGCGSGSSYLTLACVKAGVFLDFPMGSDMLIEEDEISFKAKFDKDFYYYYPIADGRWLVAQLSGNDMPVIIKALNEGKVPEFNFYEV